MIVGKSELIRRLSDRRKPLTESQVRLLIDSLWRDVKALLLYFEKADRTDEKYKPAIFNDLVDFAQAIGLDHTIDGEESIAIGIGNITKSFREIIIGSYATEAAGQTFDSWNELDRLLAIGNGLNDENRRLALELYKSGFLELKNGLKIGKFEHGSENPSDGTIQYTELDGLEIWKTAEVILGHDENFEEITEEQTRWFKVSTDEHDHEIGNVKLLFENQLT